MDIVVRLTFAERGAVRLLNWLAQENAIIITEMDQRARTRGERPLPYLYESGVVYRREVGEVWSDYLNTLMEGQEDCDALSAIRAGELIARGYRALTPRDERDPLRYPGDEGFAVAQRLRPNSIHAEVFLTTKTEPGKPGLYHCLTRYKIAGKWYVDDPSARLGMYGYREADLSRSYMLQRRQGRGGNSRSGVAGIEVRTMQRKRVRDPVTGEILELERVV